MIKTIVAFLALKNTNEKFKEEKKSSNSNNNYNNNNNNNNNNQQVVESKHWQIKPQKRVVLDDYEVVHRRQKGVTTALYWLYLFLHQEPA